MDVIEKGISRLTAYGLKTGLIKKEDIRWTINSILSELGIYETALSDGQIEEECGNIAAQELESGAYLESCLSVLCDYAAEKGLIEENTVVYRDLFDTRLMGILTPRPSELIAGIEKLRQSSAKAATEAYYRFSMDTDYIRRYRISRDIRWRVETEYGELDISINLSKPEKDPKAIAAAGRAKQSGYPKCQLCRECEGYSGRLDYPARQNHRILPVKIQGEEWGLQYSPYVYYNEHCIVFNQKHTPMKIDGAAFLKLFDFVKQYPHYFVGSNADLPIVGGSILSHEHFQGGNYSFAMARAGVEREFKVRGYEDVSAGIVKWPMSVIRLSGSDTERIAELGEHILKSWREYTDESAFIYAYTDGAPHSTITPIARKAGEEYQLDLVLRNNICTDEHPLGVFHPHEELHHIKKENIGLIEVMGLAVLPSRLKDELGLLRDVIINGGDPEEYAELKKHAEWVREIIAGHGELNKDNAEDVLKNEVGKVFLRVLENAGVYKRTPEGQAAFDRFTKSL